ncbi:unnamed protein product [Echinostoma caproni]|uniref:TIR domain-containing protein n=1 Tax=Echinostoma caproni TaxID=27848 RepID=A0A183A763_9TREM|nr:unnamed protein product [Echinostoma caproni]
MLDSGKADEEEEALLTLWTLSFDQENRIRIEQEFGPLLETVQHKLYSTSQAVGLNDKSECSSNEPVTQNVAADFVTSELEQEDDLEELMNRRKRQTTAAMRALKGLIWQLGSSEAKQSREQKADSTELTGKHVMISYNHQHKHIASEIAQRLRQKDFKVWIDSDCMRSVDDLMDGMAMAVENAFVVLILFSKAYQDSPNTRSAYRPNGWLGIMLGARIYLDFSGKYPFEKKFEELLFSLNKVANKNPENADSTTQSISPTKCVEPSQSEPKSPETTNVTKPETAGPPSFSKWGEEETSEWLKRSNAEWHGQEALTGGHLLFLSKLAKDSPEFFYETLKNFGGLSNLTMLMNFTTALHQLSS